MDEPQNQGNVPSETAPLLGGQRARVKKPFYRARPLWVVPFAVLAAIVRGMTIAPRVVVFTQLACTAIHGPIDYNHTTFVAAPLPHANITDPYFNIYPDVHTVSSLVPVDISEIPFFSPSFTPEFSTQTTTSKRCLKDPKVQARAARLQAATTTTMGLLSALTAGWWGHAAERIGRTRVLAAAVLGPLLADLLYLLVTTLPVFTTSTAALRHAEIGLVLASALEGLFGGWTSIQAGTTAYISDCTSPGSRAHIFSRFTGTFFTGFSIGPMVAAAVISHGLGPWVAGSVSGVFAVSASFSAFNFLLAFFLFPESLSKEKRAAHTQVPPPIPEETSSTAVSKGAKNVVKALLGPLAVLLPVKVPGQNSRDWNLTFLAATFFGYLFAAGIFQIKYLYAAHVYEWEAQTLSYYISWVSGFRAFTLLFILPVIISVLKPKRKTTPTPPNAPIKKPVVSPAQIARELRFDLAVSKVSLALDVVSHLSVTMIPSGAPAGYFIAFTTLSSCGAGLVPALQSVALSFVNLRADAAAATGSTLTQAAAPGAGQLLGAMAVLHATGQMILGPLMFGAIFSATVATYPKAVFATAGGICVAALILLFMVRPAPSSPKRKRVPRTDEERGRSRVSKDLGRRTSQASVNHLPVPAGFAASTSMGSTIAVSSGSGTEWASST